MSFRII